MAYLLKSNARLASIETAEVLTATERQSIISQLSDLSAHSTLHGLIIDHRNAQIDMTLDDSVSIATSIIKLHEHAALLFIYLIACERNRFIIDASVSLAASRGVPIYVFESEDEARKDMKRRFPHVSASEPTKKTGDGDSLTAITPTQTHRLSLVKNPSEHSAFELLRRKITTELRQTGPRTGDSLDSKTLSRREGECLLAAANGMTEKETARLLGISPNTVAVHIANCRLKLNARNKLQAVVKGIALIEQKVWCRFCAMQVNSQ